MSGSIFLGASLGASPLRALRDAPNMPLNDIVFRNAEPQKKPYRLFDRDGLYFEICPNGSKLRRLKFLHNQKEKRLALGAYPLVDLKRARMRTSDAHSPPNDMLIAAERGALPVLQKW